MTVTEAREFISVWHRHNDPPVSALFAIGLAEGEEIVGCAIVERPKGRGLDDGWVAEVSRTCTRPECPKGGISKLLGTCRRICGIMGYRKVVTYTLASESGASLRGAGWTQAQFLQPRGGWSCKARRRGKGRVDNTAKIRWEVDVEA